MRARWLALVLVVQAAACIRLKDGDDRLASAPDDAAKGDARVPVEAGTDGSFAPKDAEPDAPPADAGGAGTGGAGTGGQNGIDGGPKIDDPKTVCGDGSKDDDEYCDTTIAAGEEGTCPVSCPPQAGCYGYELEGSDCGARCVEVPIAIASNGDGCCPPGFTSATDTDCQCTGADCPQCDDDHPCPSPFECCDGHCVDTAGVCGWWPCVPGTARDLGNCGGCGMICTRLACCDTGADAGCPAADGGAGDCCPDDQNKTAPGQCGCGVADRDSDDDGAADCVDECAADPNKIRPGTCGCGRIDADMGSTVGCAGLVGALRHRYRFDGSGTTVADSRGSAAGTAVNVSLTNTGSLALAGGTSNEYVDLPNGIASALTDATFEVYVTWDGGNAWQSILNFGSNSSPTEGNQGTSATTYLFVTPRAAGSSTALRAVFSSNGYANEVAIDGSAALATGGMHQVVVVIDDTANQMRLYLDGALQGQVAFPGHLSELNDINNWFGRSQFTVDPEFDGTLHEFRIYGAPLSAGQVALSFADGPDPAYLP